MAEQTNQNQTVDIQEELLKRYEALPQDLKDTMMSVETAETIFEIGKKFGLNIEKTGKLAEEIGFVILGVIPSKDFVEDIKDILGVDDEKALGVASEVNHRIFLKIRDTLKTMHGVRWVDQIAEKPIDTERQKSFAEAERRVMPAETFEKNKEEIPSILAEIKPTTPQQPAHAAEKTLPVITEIKPEITAAGTVKVPPLDTSHEIESPKTGSGQGAAAAGSQQPPEGLPIEQPTADGQQPAADNQQQPAPQQPNKYLVDPYREPFE